LGQQFPLHFPSRASPCAITFQLDSATASRHLRAKRPTGTDRAGGRRLEEYIHSDYKHGLLHSFTTHPALCKSDQISKKQANDSLAIADM